MTTRILAIANQKGGVGKTSLTLGLAAAMANASRRVLVVDMDPQSNASQTLLPDYDVVRDDDDFYTTNDVLEDGGDPTELAEAIRGTQWPHVDVIPSHQALASRDLEGVMGIEFRLRKMLTGLPADTYDAVLLDCPPSVGRLTANAFLAASEVLLVCKPDRYGQNALNQIDKTLSTVRDTWGHEIGVAGLVINMYEKTNEADMRREQLQERFGDQLLAVIPKRTAVVEAAGHGESVFTLTRRDAPEVAGWYADLARKVGLIGPREAVLGRTFTEADGFGEHAEMKAAQG